MENPISNLINKISDLTEAQRKVADYILKKPMDVAFLTVDQLAGIVGTSTTTIMRLTYSLGYSGYTEFQKGLQEHFRSQTAPQSRLEANLKGLDSDDLWTSYVEHQINNIQSTVEMISTSTLNETIEMIVSAERIYCTSVRSGMPVAQYLTHGFNRLLGNCELILADLSDWIDKVVSFTSSDLIIVTTFPRYAKRIIELVYRAKENGAKVIAITDNYSSPIVKYSDLVIPSNSDSIAFHNSAVPAMFVADYLISAVAIRNPGKTKERLDKINSILTDMKYHHQ
ncbi:MurR/RpiR family transcriptional regulator [Pontibacillus marinus]|uniref:Transcriptional regulator n=1 Tax=Pontibacillus marinus BH030004 = DSM 16465 TaxID=1385511 RepID=A0A0A5GB85_9BACI|nr:MurR/RpiR family transcriptional regulator [Pontibacillus marinus]KGX90426.1 transcriptional regulator [Pontibacillus marinus BH030004 = DSM 16465]